MKPIELNVDEYPCGGEIAEDGQYVAVIYTSNACEGDLETAIPILAKLWDSEPEVCLNIKIKIRDVFNELIENYSIGDGMIDKEDMPLFHALYKDCKWIVEQIGALKVEE